MANTQILQGGLSVAVQPKPSPNPARAARLSAARRAKSEVGERTAEISIQPMAIQPIHVEILPQTLRQATAGDMLAELSYRGGVGLAKFGHAAGRPLAYGLYGIGLGLQVLGGGLYRASTRVYDAGVACEAKSGLSQTCSQEATVVA